MRIFLNPQIPPKKHVEKEGFERMNCEEAIAYIHTNKWAGRRPGLERIRTLLEAIGNPQRELRCIHVAGTNGKGSVCAMLDSILRAYGYRVGLFTSPYIRRFQERMRVDGLEIPDAELAEITEYIRPFAEAMEERPTEFELITAIGFEFFRRRGVDIVVLEVGLGGRLDPTNVIESSLLSIITDIDFDHTAELGNTLQAIAAEKAGIIKNGCPSLFGGKDSSACRTVRAVAAMRKSYFHTVDRSAYSVKSLSLDGTVFDFQDYLDLHLSLLGGYQPSNAAIVLTALEILREAGIEGSEEALRYGLSTVRWPARFELMRCDPIVICDGGHNPQGVGAAVKSVRAYFPEETVNVLTGVMTDKDYDSMIERLKPITRHAYTVTPHNPRALSAEEYAAQFKNHKIPATAYASVGEALQAAIRDSRDNGCPLLCLGSLYLYGEVADELEGLAD